MSTSLENDLIVRRGGAKRRLIARCWVASHRLPMAGPYLDDPIAYEAFQKLHDKKSFLKLHQMFDPILPVEFRS